MVDCKRYADEILNSITGYGYLAVVSVGDNPASMSYIKGKQKDCERVGFEFKHYHFPDTATEDEILSLIDYLNGNREVTGIIVQLPLPDGLDADTICNHVAREKDVDGFRPDSPFKPCTPEGVVHILHKELGDLTGKIALIIGRGKLVGRPLKQMLLDEDMTVIVCHSKTPKHDITVLSQYADAVVVAVGKPKAIDLMWVRGNAVIVDCGVNRDSNGKLCGDVKQSFSLRVTPVPGGVGLLTRAMLMKHVERK